MKRAGLLLLVMAAAAVAGGRARPGGTLTVAAVVKAAHGDPLLADTPLEATLTGLTRLPPCRLGELSRPTPRTVRLTIRASTRSTDVAAALTRVKDTPSPYRALLSAVKSIATPNANIVELELDGPAPEVEAALCHPALATAPSTFAVSDDRLLLNADPALPRAWLDAIVIRATDARTAERLLAQRKVQVLLGAEAGEGPMLYATYLVAHPKLGTAFAQAVESSVDRPGLTRFFVRPPVRPLTSLFPPSIEGAARRLPAEPPALPARPAPLPSPVELTLIYDAALDEHRAVAERLQVKLGPLGYRLKLEALARRELRERLGRGPDLALVGVLLPPRPAPALQVLLGLAGQPTRLAELDPLPEATRDDAVFERVARGLPTLFPLFVQGLGVSSAREVQHLTRDEYGLPRLDDVFLAGE